MTSTAQLQLFLSSLLRLLLSYLTACAIADGYFRTLFVVLLKANAIIIVEILLFLYQHAFLLSTVPIVPTQPLDDNNINPKYIQMKYCIKPGCLQADLKI